MSVIIISESLIIGGSYFFTLSFFLKNSENFIINMHCIIIKILTKINKNRSVSILKYRFIGFLRIFHDKSYSWQLFSFRHLTLVHLDFFFFYNLILFNIFKQIYFPMLLLEITSLTKKIS